MTRDPHTRERPGKINPDAGEPEKGAPDIGETARPGRRDPDDGDEPFPPDPLKPKPSEA